MPVRRRLPADPMLMLCTAGALAEAPLRLWKKWKKLQRPGHGHEADPRRWSCVVSTGRGRRGIAHDGKAAGPRVVFVGRGFGEMRMIERLSDALRAARPDAAVVWCFQTEEPASQAAALRPDQPIVAVPFDFAVPIHNWLRNVSPDVVVFVEQFDYPMLVRAASKADVRLCLVNGLSWAKDAKGPLRGPAQRAFRRWMTSAFSVMSFQSPEQIERARRFLAPEVAASMDGNVKFDAEPQATKPETAAWLAARGPVPLLAAGSTRLGDEEFVLRAFAAVRATAPCALLIAPRQIARRDEIEKIVRSAGFTLSRRSDGPHAAPADVYLLDTMGELLASYGESIAAYVGGSIAHQGHNVIEPVVWGLPVSYGMRRGAWKTEQGVLEANGIGTRVSTPEELAAHWICVLSQPAFRADVKSRGAALLERQRGATARSVARIVSLLDETTHRSPSDR